MRKWFSTGSSEGDAELSSALADWKRGPEAPPSLSPAARAALWTRLRENVASARPIPALFRPVHRWVVVATVPLVLTAGLVWLERQGGEATPETLRIQASKQGSDVVFTIANGQGTHQVVKSDAPDRFDASTRITVRNGGSFRDEAAGGPDLVFYRVD